MQDRYDIKSLDQDYLGFYEILSLSRSKPEKLCADFYQQYQNNIEQMLDLDPFIQCLTSDQKKSLFSQVYIKHYYSGQKIYTRSERCTEVFFILSGVVQMGWTGIDGKRIIHRFLPRGSLINIIYLVSNTALEHDYMAHQATTLLKIPGDLLLQLFGQNSKLMLYVFQQICARNRLLDNEIFYYHNKSLCARLARQLLELMQDFGLQQQQKIMLDIKLSQENLAELLKSSRHSIRKAIADLVSQGIIENNYNKFYIVDLNKLRRLL